MKLIILSILLLAIVYALSRVSGNAVVRKVSRGMVRAAGYGLALLSAVMVYLSFSREYGTFTLLGLALVPAFGSWFTFQLWRHSLSLEQGK